MTGSLTEKQLAARWQMKHRTLQNWRQLGKGPEYFKLHSGPRAPVRYSIEAIQEFERMYPGLGKPNK